MQAMVTGQTMQRRTTRRIHKEMIGRTTILAEIRSSVRSLVQRNTGSLLMIAGDAGHGKSKLLMHLAKSEEFEGFRSEFQIFRASGTPERQPVPLTPWRSVLLVRRSLFTNGTFSFFVLRALSCLVDKRSLATLSRSTAVGL